MFPLGTLEANWPAKLLVLYLTEILHIGGGDKAAWGTKPRRGETWGRDIWLRLPVPHCHSHNQSETHLLVPFNKTKLHVLQSTSLHGTKCAQGCLFCASQNYSAYLPRSFCDSAHMKATSLVWSRAVSCNMEDISANV